MIRAFLQVNGRFQVYTTQNTTGMTRGPRAFLQVNCRFQVYTTQDTTGMIGAFLQVNCRFSGIHYPGYHRNDWSIFAS